MNVYKLFLKVTAILVITLLAHSCSKEKPSSATQEELTKQNSKVKKQERVAQESPSNAPVKVAPSPQPQKKLTTPEVVAAPVTPAVSDEMSNLPSPKPGDKIYTWDNLPETPENSCGEFWVKDSDGKIIKVHMCRDQH